MVASTAQKPTEIFASYSKKRTVVIVAVVFVMLLIFALSGYFVKQNSETDKNLENSENNIQKTVSTGDGNVVIKEGKLPSDFPKDVVMYSNAKIKTSTESSTETRVTLLTSDSVNKVSEFYNKDLEKNGWQITQSSTTNETSLILAEKDSRNLVVTVVVDKKEDKTVILLVVGPKS